MLKYSKHRENPTSGAKENFNRYGNLSNFKISNYREWHNN